MTSVALSEEITTSPLLKEIEQRLIEVAGNPGSTCSDLAADLIKAGGKRLRPLLVVLSAGETSRHRSAVIDVAVAVELIHTASLIHDDILDSAALRRGIPTINSTRGSHTAVLTGDYLFAAAFSHLIGRESVAALPILTDAIRLLCQGEIDETASLYNPQVRETDYFSRIGKKTASLLTACCAAGALVGGAESETVASVAAFGRNLGFCFQVTDDLLDFASDETALGKPAGSDIAQGIVTLPVIRLLQDPQYGERVSAILEQRACSGENLDYINRAVHDSGALDYTGKVAQHFAREARSSLAAVPLLTVRNSLLALTDMIAARGN